MCVRCADDVCDTWWWCVWYVVMMCVVCGNDVCNTWWWCVLYVEMMCAVCGNDVCDMWRWCVWYVVMLCVICGDVVCDMWWWCVWYVVMVCVICGDDVRDMWRRCVWYVVMMCVIRGDDVCDMWLIGLWYAACIWQQILVYRILNRSLDGRNKKSKENVIREQMKPNKKHTTWFYLQIPSWNTVNCWNWCVGSQELCVHCFFSNDNSRAGKIPRPAVNSPPSRFFFFFISAS